MLMSRKINQDTVITPCNPHVVSRPHPPISISHAARYSYQSVLPAHLSDSKDQCVCVCGERGKNAVKYESVDEERLSYRKCVVEMGRLIREVLTQGGSAGEYSSHGGHDNHSAG